MSHKEDTRNLKLEIDHLQRKLHDKQRSGTPSSSRSQSDDDDSYRPRSRTPPRRRRRSPTCRGLENDAVSRALHQISKSPFTRRIERGKLASRFNQPTFTMCNGRTNPVDHVSHFNQRMVVHSKNKDLMCKVFLSILGLVVMRWFDGLEKGSISSLQELTRAFRT